MVPRHDAAPTLILADWAVAVSFRPVLSPGVQSISLDPGLPPHPWGPSALATAATCWAGLRAEQRTNLLKSTLLSDCPPVSPLSIILFLPFACSTTQRGVSLKARPCITRRSSVHAIGSLQKPFSASKRLCLRRKSSCLPGFNPRTMCALCDSHPSKTSSNVRASPNCWEDAVVLGCPDRRQTFLLDQTGTRRQPRRLG